MTKVRFTKPTMNYAVGDVVELDKKALKLVDEYIDEYVEGGEDDKDRYEELKDSKVKSSPAVAPATANPPKTELSPAPVTKK